MIIRNKGCVSKLEAVKLLKKLTGLGLKDSKDIIDKMLDVGIYDFQNNDYDISHGIIQEFNHINIDISSNRDENLILLLTKILIKITNKNVEYRIFDGSFNIKGQNILQLNIKDGLYQKFNSEMLSIIIEQELKNNTITLPWTECEIIEEN